MSRYDDVDSPDYNDTNLGDPRETPEEKEIARLERKIVELQNKLAAERRATTEIENAALERCAAIAEDHEHADDDFVCAGYNCGSIIAAAIRALKN